jgi:hypothetical protein
VCEVAHTQTGKLSSEGAWDKCVRPRMCSEAFRVIWRVIAAAAASVLGVCETGNEERLNGGEFWARVAEVPVRSTPPVRSRFREGPKTAQPSPSPKDPLRSAIHARISHSTLGMRIPFAEMHRFIAAATYEE